MEFGQIAVGPSAIGAILGHSVSLPDAKLHKGHVLAQTDIDRLTLAGIESVLAARMGAGDVPEDVAAKTIAEACAGANVRMTAAFTGRANLYADRAGLVLLDRGRIDALNSIDEALTLATLSPFDIVAPGDMLATVKVIPFSVPESALNACLALAQSGPGSAISVAAFSARKFGLVITRTGNTKSSVIAKTEAVVRDRVVDLGCNLSEVAVCPHDSKKIAEELARMLAQGVDIALVFGATAIVDRRDIIPTAIELAGGKVEHFGMPVDPGNLLLFGRIGQVPVVGVPGCARSPKLNGFDWVLRRLVAGLEISRRDVAEMGVGGLLKEIATRPLPREKAVSPKSMQKPPAIPRIAALVMAAGRSTRMGIENKLLRTIGGKPMVAHVVDAARQSSARPIIVVVGHQAEQVRAAIGHSDVTVIENPAYRDGMATSLKAGLARIPDDCDGVLVCLGDMPSIESADMNKLIAAFNPAEGRSICVPTFNGKRGNPVLWSSSYFQAMMALKGDVGARHLIGENADQVREVPMDSEAILIDLDTPASFAEFSARSS